MRSLQWFGVLVLTWGVSACSGAPGGVEAAAWPAAGAGGAVRPAADGGGGAGPTRAAGAGSTAPAASVAGRSAAGASASAAGASGVSGGAAAGVSGQAASGQGGTGGVTSAAGAAGVSEAGSAGAAAGAGAQSGTGCAGAVVCDGFESGAGAALDAARWQTVSPNCSGDGQVTLDAQVAHSGAFSARVQASGGYCNHVFLQAKASLPAEGPLYGRFFVRVSTALNAEHVTFMTLRDEQEGKDLRMGGQSEILMWNRESDDATLPELSPTGIAASVKLTPLSWTCIEFMVDGAQRSLSTWVDGVAVPGLQIEGEPTPDVDAQWKRKADWAPRLSDVKWGWESYGGSANTLWFDDVALSTQRLGCKSD